MENNCVKEQKITFKLLAESRFFLILITTVIILNAILIGIELTSPSGLVSILQNFCLYIFIAEIFIRWLGKDNIKGYFSNSWNIFDILIVSIAVVPDYLIQNSELLVALRLLRIFRILRLFKANDN